MNVELAALKAVNFDWTRHLDSVWDDRVANSKELNGALADDLADYVIGSTEPGGRSPLGRIIIGAAGAGKTHLVGELRRQVWQEGGWFILLDLADVNEFWPTAALSYLQSLQRTFDHRNHARGRSPLAALRHNPGDCCGAEEQVQPHL